VGKNGQLYHIWQTTPSGIWNSEGWQSFGGDWPGTPPVVAHNADGRFEVFLVGKNGQLYHIWQTTPSGIWNSEGWQSFGGDWPAFVPPLPFNNQDGRLEVFLVGKNGQLYHRFQTEIYQMAHKIRIQGIKMADDLGGRETSITFEEAKRWVDYANQVYGEWGIQFLFDRSTDWTPALRNSLVNRIMGGTGPNWTQSRDAANVIARQYPDKIVVFFRFGPDAGPTGNGFSDYSLDFVVMPGFPKDVTQVCDHQNIGLLAHELGHYMGLSHTFPDDPRTGRAFLNESDALSYFNARGNDVNAFDGDKLGDTLTDPYIDITDFQCRRTTILTLDGRRFILPRHNIMSYYDEEIKTITSQQSYLAHQTLTERAHILGLSINEP
jgi:hypothetical protein